VDEVLKIELGSSLHIDVLGFYETFFGEIAGLETTAASVFAKCQKGNNPLYNQERGWHGWPEDAKEKDVLRWFAGQIKTFIDFAEDVGSATKVQRRPLA